MDHGVQIKQERVADVGHSTRLDHWREEEGIGQLVLFHHRPSERGGETPVGARLLPLDPA